MSVRPRPRQAPSAGMQWLTLDPGHNASGRLAEGDSGGEVNTVAQMAICDIGGAAPSSDPGHGQCRGHHPWTELFNKALVSQHPSGQEDVLIRKRRIEIDVGKPRRGRRNESWC